MARSVADVRHLLEESQHRMLVWEHVVNYLSAFVDTEGREARSEIRRSKDTPSVPQSLIASIVESIEAEKISPLREEINKLENLPVVETKDGEGNKAERSEARPKANPKRVRIVAKPG